MSATDENQSVRSPEATGKITVLQERYNQSLTFSFLHDVTYDEGFVALNATASSGLPVAFTVEGPGFQVLGNRIQLTGVGE